MIKGIIMDVDGVIVGKKRGVNFPLPNKTVIEKLKELNANGIPVILCTAKFGYAIHEIIKKAKLHNPHITDGGALIIDLHENKIITKQVFDKKLAEEIAASCIEKNIYLETYGIKDYYVQKSQINEFTHKRAELLQKQSKIVDIISDEVKKTDIIKFIGFAENEKDRKRIDKTLAKFKDKINFIWSYHPALAPVQIGIITIKGVSKKHASIEVLKYLNISPAETLGIGDLLSDWNFIELCGYAATVENGSEELKELITQKGIGKYFIGKSVDENGFIDIINHFQNIITPVAKAQRHC